MRKAQAVRLEVLGKTSELVAMQAGLECGVVGEKHPGMQMISFGRISWMWIVQASGWRSLRWNRFGRS